MRVLSRVTGFGALRKLLLIRDANGEATAAQAELTVALRAGGFATPAQSGLVTSPGADEHAVRVGFFLMPGGGRPGALEDWLWPAARCPERARCSERAVECARADGLPDRAVGKARTHAYLALLDRPPDTYRMAVSEGRFEAAFDLEHPALADLVEFLRQV